MSPEIYGDPLNVIRGRFDEESAGSEKIDMALVMKEKNHEPRNAGNYNSWDCCSPCNTEENGSHSGPS